MSEPVPSPAAAIAEAAALLARGEAAAARTGLEAALAAAPDDAGLHNSLGRALFALGDPAGAWAQFTTAARLDPDFAEPRSNAGALLIALRRFEDAVTVLRDAVARHPGHAPAYSNLGLALIELERLDEAGQVLGAAVERFPNYERGHTHLGDVRRLTGDFAGAVDSYRQAAALAPGDPRPLHDLGLALDNAGALDEARACLDAAVTLAPDDADARLLRASVQLRQGDYRQGWAEYEWRWRTAAFRPMAARFPTPRWAGEDPHGRTLLLHSEQGFGDYLQFCRYAPLVAARGARVLLEAPGPLLRLMRSLRGPAEVLESGSVRAGFDLHCPLMSLPLACGTTLATIPARVPYLAADPALVAAWAGRLGGLPRPRVGLVWAGSGRAGQFAARAIDRRRSTRLADWAPVLAQPGVTFVSLQTGPPAAEAAAHGGIVDLTAHLTDFAETAALIEGLDLVIAVDTAVAHLAGAMAKPVWLLSRFDGCWRWLAGRTDSPWYPTMRLFVQPAPGDWRPVTAAIAAALAEWRSTS